MSFREDVLKVLSGGLPTLLEFPEGAEQTTVAVVPVEQVAPEPTNRDSEPFFMGVTQNQILAGTAGLVALIGLVFLARKL